MVKGDCGNKVGRKMK